MFTTYRLLYQFIITADAEHRIRTKDQNDSSSSSSTSTDHSLDQDPSIDVHFRSGVLLGAGFSHLVLSLLPSRLTSLASIFGFTSSRAEGLSILYSIGGWNTATAPGMDNIDLASVPLVSKEEEGVRRSLADIALLIYFLVITSFTHTSNSSKSSSHPLPDASLTTSRILAWNSSRYPDGTFFLFGQGRESLIKARPAEAVKFYSRAVRVRGRKVVAEGEDEGYGGLNGVSWWEIAIAKLALWEMSDDDCSHEFDDGRGEGSETYWRRLWEGASWSKACYAYGVACCILQRAEAIEARAQVQDEVGEENGKVERLDERDKLVKEAKGWFEKVPRLTQRIAGKSIPMEVRIYVFISASIFFYAFFLLPFF
jgi:hypothetical protein